MATRRSSGFFAEPEERIFLFTGRPSLSSLNESAMSDFRWGSVSRLLEVSTGELISGSL